MRNGKKTVIMLAVLSFAAAYVASLPEVRRYLSRRTTWRKTGLGSDPASLLN